MMSKIFTLALLVASTQAYKIKIAKNNLDVTTCMAGTNAVISDISLNVSPFPIDFAEGKKIHLDGNFMLNTVIESGAKLHLKLKGITIFGELTLPCIAVSIYNQYLPNTGYQT